VRSIRLMISESAPIPKTLRTAINSVAGDGNPWSGRRSERNQWAAGLLPAFDKTRTEYLFFGCCMPSYDPRSRKLAEAAVKVLKAAGITAGVLGTEESCCGESVRRAGNEPIWERVAASNTGLFEAAGVEKILVLSPHCYHTFKNEYEGLRGRQVVHMSQLLADLLQAGKIELKKPLEATVTYHDPCYLGRHNDVYDAPRAVLAALPGATFKEMIRVRETSLCCGGGGGRMWVETAVGERFSDLRLPEAMAVGASVLATACPYCINMFESSRLTIGDENAIQVKDVTELVAEALA